MEYPHLSSYQYCANNPLIKIDPDGNQTLQISWNNTAGAGAGITASSGIAFGRDGIRPFAQCGGGSFIGASSSSIIDFTFSLNSSVDQLAGTVMTNGGSISVGPLAVGIEINTPIDGSGSKGSLSISVGLTTPSPTAIGGEAHSFIQNAAVFSQNNTTTNVDLGDRTGAAPADATNTTTSSTTLNASEGQNQYQYKYKFVWLVE
jgi:hypothetical protein